MEFNSVSKCTLLIFLISLVLSSSIDTRTLEVGKNETINGFVSAESEAIYNVDISDSEKTQLRVSSTTSANKNDPIVFLIRSNQLFEHWQIPSKTFQNNSDYSSSLCIPPNSANLKLIISTSSASNQSFEVRLSLQKQTDIQITDGSTRSAVISPTRREVFRLNLGAAEIHKKFLVKVFSEQNVPVCSLIRILPIGSSSSCPDYYEDNSVSGKTTFYQTMLNTSAIVLNSKDFPHGAFILIKAKESDVGCYKKTVPVDVPADRTMKVSVSLESLPEEPVKSTVIILAVYTALCMIAGVCSFISFR